MGDGINMMIGIIIVVVVVQVLVLVLLHMADHE